MARRPVRPVPRGRALVAVAAAIGAVVVVAGNAGACASSSPSAGSAAGCARARLARQWSTARVEAFGGCWAYDELPGVLVLTDLPVVVGGDGGGADGAYADEPPTFCLTSTTALLPGATQQQWELLSPTQVRLTWAKGFDVVSACLVADDADRATTLVGELRVAGQADPLPRPPRPARWRRVDCPR